MALNDVPLAPQTLAATQNPIRQNFSIIDTSFAINHIGYGVAGTGKHLYLQLPEHAAPVTAVNEAGFYANVGATSAVTELYFRRENNGVSIPMSETVEVTASNGWTYLPSGVIMQWMTQVINNNTLVTFPKAMTKTYSVSLTNKAGGASQVVYTIITEVVGVSVNASAKTRNAGTPEATNTYIIIIGV